MNKKSGKPTLTDIARTAGLTESTVSKALRGESDINLSTAARVRKIAAQIGYDATRLNSRVRDDFTVGAVFSELNSEYYHGMYDAFREKMKEGGARVVTMVTDYSDGEAVNDAVEYLLKRRAGGLFVLSDVGSDLARVRELIKKSGTPSVFVTNETDLDFCDSINVNHPIGVNLILSELLRLGHERIAFVGDRYTVARERVFRQMMERSDCGLREELVSISAGRSVAGGYEAAGRILDLPEGRRPTAIFAAYDNLAYGVYRAAAERGIRIPEDLSVGSIDDNQASACMTPGLTSVRVPVQEIGERAAGLILSRMRGDPSPLNSILLTPAIVKRGSISVPKGAIL
ncbi:MAG: LacI family DNA-binding transcriptional regulator [Clostridia bacterium]|nr:LacI family DNA-binding transcriptional regulator [Clostridia bacterium]